MMPPRHILKRPSTADKTSRPSQSTTNSDHARNEMNTASWRETASKSGSKASTSRQLCPSVDQPPEGKPPSSLPPPPPTRRWETSAAASTSFAPQLAAPTSAGSSTQQHSAAPVPTSPHRQASMATKSRRINRPTNKVKATASFSLADFVSSAKQPASSSKQSHSQSTGRRNPGQHHHQPSRGKGQPSNAPPTVNLAPADGVACLHSPSLTPRAEATGIPPAVLQRPKKKKLSTLKKRVLKDQAAKWAAFHSHTTTSDQTLPADAATAISPSFVRTIQVIHLVDPDEVQDDDEYADTLVDVTSQFAKFGAITSLALDRATGTIEIEYDDAASATNAAMSLDNAVFGGQHVSCLVVAAVDEVGSAQPRNVVIRGFCNADEMEDPDEFDEILDEVRTTFGTTPHPPSRVEIDRSTGHITLEYATPKQAKEVASAYHNKTYGGTSITAVWSAHGSAHTDVGLAQALSPNKGEAINELPPPRRLPNTQAIREYVDQRVDVGGEVESMVVAFLGRLMSLQERARLTNPLKAKKTRRLVFGLREVKRGLKNGGLDDIVMELINLARVHGIPVIFSLSKRKLGKALLKTIRVSCVGVYNVDGANELWAELKKKVATLQSHPAHPLENATEAAGAHKSLDMPVQDARS
ncbi:hypothetical protein, variant [Aphanomyces invadans]|uniref:Ribosomal protein L7Ae/L30e/S12e/Gadd45 domain-containing protein n=1 Tax=Aphanomyces invadans TaxID=157072 RepID=A0A024TWE1_9STRA|nr:hypothetical protein, variant [Aphanomyces invadans]ETV98309.1 hypothetical protein, variant [Aphanomyces invadans]|eukprot:XP_008873184.1 hypothetical protein, variant [Aphanomyces invadans]